MFSISIYYRQILLYNLCMRDPSLERRCSMTTSVLEKSLSYDDLIASLRLIDDDFVCKEVESMNYEVLKKQVGYYKESEGGKREMCEIWQKIRDEGYLNGKEEGYIEGEMNKTIEFIKKLTTKNGFTIEDAMELLDIPMLERPKYIHKILS